MDKQQIFDDMCELFDSAENHIDLILKKNSFLKKIIGINSTFYGFILNPNHFSLSEVQRVAITKRTQGSYRYSNHNYCGAVLDFIRYTSNHPKAWLDAIEINPFLFECTSYYELISNKNHLWLDLPDVGILPDGIIKKNESELRDRLGGCSMSTGLSLINSGKSKHFIPSCFGGRSSLVNALEFRKLWSENGRLICSVLQKFDERMRRTHITDFLGLTKKEVEVLDNANIPQQGIEFILDREACTIERRTKSIKEKLRSPSLQAAAMVATKLGV